MATTPTSSTSGQARRAGLFDELVKISEATAPEAKKPTLKKWLKNTALIAGGAGVGTAVAMAADKLSGSKLGPTWGKLDTKAKKAIVGALLGASTVGAGLVGQKMMEERYRRDRE